MEGAHHVPYSERTIYDDTTNFSFGDINNGLYLLFKFNY